MGPLSIVLRLGGVSIIGGTVAVGGARASGAALILSLDFGMLSLHSARLAHGLIFIATMPHLTLRS